MKRKFFATAFLASVLSLSAIAAGCAPEVVSIKSIDKNPAVDYDENGNRVDHYIITYTNGTTSSFTVTNGKDGKDGKDGTYVKEISVEEVYETFKSIYGDEITFEEFCERYMSKTEDSAAAVGACLRSSLKVYSVFNEPLYSSFSGGGVKEECYAGSSVIYKIYDDYTYLLTNYHVIYDVKAVNDSKLPSKIGAYIYGSEGKPDNSYGGGYQFGSNGIECTYVGGSAAYDVAVIRAKTADVLKINPQAESVKIKESYAVGESVFAIGNSNNEGISVTGGMVSVDSESIPLSVDGIRRNYRVLRTDVAVTHGNSGGGLFNEKGELIGLINSGDDNTLSMNYAIPASSVKGVADGIMWYYFSEDPSQSTYRPYLGLTTVTQNTRFVYDELTGTGKIKEDLYVEKLETGKIAKRSGLELGDIITAIGIKGIRYNLDRTCPLGDLLLRIRAGDTITFYYVRGGEERTSSTVTVGKDDMIEVDR